ncbi:MAG TPA: thrombospondin type 3 repeat-containing protein [Dehalococcoidia bacterium]|nr:thrombospondin type 3 repeat-containing protein [Dehalococcoidia bacterium]
MKSAGVAALAIVAVLTGFIAFGPAANAANGKDHWYAVSLSTTANGSHPNVTTKLALCTGVPIPGTVNTGGCGPSAAYDTQTRAAAPVREPFFAAATNISTGLTLVSGGAQTPGENTGTISFDINTQGGTFASGGQPNQCGNIAQVGATFQIYQAKLQPTSGNYNSGAGGTGKLVSSGPDKGAGNPGDTGLAGETDPTASFMSYDQEPNLVTATPAGVDNTPTAIVNIENAVGIPSAAILTRSFGVAIIAPGVSQTSVNFIQVATSLAAGAGTANVTVLGDPFGASNPSGQATTTCSPFDSTVTVLGVTGAGPAVCAAPVNPNVVTPVYPCRTTALAGGTNEVTISAANGTNQAYFIGLGATPDYDGDGVVVRDNCAALPNPTQTDSAGNGIGDACRAPAVTSTGTGWTNVDPTAFTNASKSCTADGVTPNTAPGVPTIVGNSSGSETVQSAGWFPCQDADNDGWLNSTDNCPLTANVDQLSTSGDGIGNACHPGPLSAAGYPVAATLAHPIRGAQANGTFGTSPYGGAYTHDSDICTAPWVVGGPSGDLLISCLADQSGASSNTGSSVVTGGAVSNGVCGAVLTFPGIQGTCAPMSWFDSNNDGTPDYLCVDKTTGNQCTGATTTANALVWRDHAADSNADGYSDADETLKLPDGVTSVVGCAPVVGGCPPNQIPGSASATDTGFCTAACASAGYNINPLGAPRPNSAGVGEGCGPTPLLAKSDVNTDGQVTIGDFGKMTPWFGQKVAGGGDVRAEGDINGDSQVTIGDFGKMVPFFGKKLSVNC